MAVYLFTFILAFCSLFYELVYAQILSVCLGGTKNQYITIIAIFTFALGLGSIMQARMKKRFESRKLLFWIEFGLTVSGVVCPFLIVWILRPEHPEIFRNLAVYLSYFFVFLVGFLSGFEIPCLFDMVENAQGKVLAFDYLGMLAASVLFPFLFLPYLGTAAGLLVVVGFNILALIWLSIGNEGVKISLYGLTFLYMAGMIYYRTELNLVLSNLYLGGA